MAFDRTEGAAGGQIPKPNGVVVATADQDFVVWCHEERADPALVALQDAVFE